MFFLLPHFILMFLLQFLLCFDPIPVKFIVDVGGGSGEEGGEGVNLRRKSKVYRVIRFLIDESVL